MKSLKTYRDILRKKGLYICLREAKKTVWPIWWTHNKAAIEQIQSERVSRYLLRHYKSQIIQPINESDPSVGPTRIIWICWLQGLENAPEIVKRCVASVKQYMPKYEIRILTNENIYDYVSLPEHIVKKYKKGIIKFAHFSDILRTALLIQYGGIWIDSTVLFTGSIPSRVLDLSLFFLQQSKMQVTPHMGSSWLLVAHKGNPILSRVLELLYAYWERENKLRDYYLYHIFFYLVLTYNKQGEQAWRAIPYYSNVDSHTLRAYLFDDYEEAGWKLFTEHSNLHKLSWKFNVNDPLDQSGTYYDYILHHLHL